MFKKHIKLKDPVTKTETHDRHKNYINLLSTVIKKSKKKYYNELFKNNMNNMKNTWKGLRNLISCKQSASPNINLFLNDHERVTKSKKTANIFNVSLSTIAENTKAKIKFSNKSFDGFLQHANKNSFFLKPTSSDEIISLISSLNEIKSVSWSKILKLLKNGI